MSNEILNPKGEHAFLKSVYDVETSLYELGETSNYLGQVSNYLDRHYKSYGWGTYENDLMKPLDAKKTNSDIEAICSRMMSFNELIDRDSKRLRNTEETKGIKFQIEQLKSQEPKLHETYTLSGLDEEKKNVLNARIAADSAGINNIMMLLLIAGLIIAVIGFVKSEANFIVGGMGSIIASVLVVRISGSKSAKSEAKVKEDYIKELNDKESSRYNAALKDYTTKMDALQKQYNERSAIREKICREGISELSAKAIAAINAIENQRSEMAQKIKELQDTRDKLYGTGILHAKYRTLDAVSTMYEYFETSRCSELAGPNGAYNLYESELRSNLIISKLDEISSKLDMIQKNQFALYEAINRTNQTLQAIQGELEAQSSVLKTIAANQNKQLKLTALNTAYAAATAANTEAIKYLTLVR